MFIWWWLSDFTSWKQFAEVCFKYHQTDLICLRLHGSTWLPAPEFLMHLKAPVLKSFACELGQKMGSLLLKDYIPVLCWCETKNLLPDTGHTVRPGKTSLTHSWSVSVLKVKGVPQYQGIAQQWILWNWIKYYLCGLKLLIINFNPIHGIMYAKVQKEKFSWNSPNSTKLFLNSKEKLKPLENCTFDANFISFKL